MTTYKNSGVNVHAADELVEETIKSLSNASKVKGVIGSIGGFGSVFDLAQLNMKDPLLITTTDGVGTKILIAIKANKFNYIGQDLVAMCINDLAATGAKPTLFLDYYATGKLNKEIATKIIRSIAQACIYSNCSLVGGETAEMPGMYKSGDLDLAGFAVGFVERKNLLPKTLDIGNTIIGLPSFGLHSNGFSLIRNIIKKEKLDLNMPAPWDPNISLSTALLEPTRIYSDIILGLQKLGIIKAAAHITGGGLAANLERVIDDNHQAVIDCNIDYHYLPLVYQWLSNYVSQDEMFEVFNCGIGMVVIVDDAEKALSYLHKVIDGATIIGMIKHRTTEPKVVLLDSYGLYFE